MNSDNAQLLHTIASRLLQVSSSKKSGADVAKDVVIIFLAGVAVVIGLVLLVYVLAMLFDRCSSVEDTTNGVDQGPIARRAGLWGLRTNERTQILEKILVPHEYNKKEESAENTEPDDQQQSSFVDDAQHETTCAICLNEYEQGDLVLSGMSCSHLFHKSCVYEWLLKHDQCPYCRKEMITSQQMKEAAEEVLGPERVLHMRMYGVDDELGLPGAAQRNSSNGDGTNETAQVELSAVSAQRMDQEDESEV